jgi:hypothetical protein
MAFVHRVRLLLLLRPEPCEPILVRIKNGRDFTIETRLELRNAPVQRCIRPLLRVKRAVKLGAEGEGVWLIVLVCSIFMSCMSLSARDSSVSCISAQSSSS